MWLHDSLLGKGVAASLDLLQTILPITANDDRKEPSVATALLAQQPIRIYQSGAWRGLAIAQRDTGSPLATAKANRTKGAPEKPKTLAAGDASAVGRRIWTSGKFTADAEFVGLEGNIVRLRRVSGIGTRIPFEKLSALDQQWIQTHLASQ